MHGNFDELKALYRSLYVNVDDLVTEGKEVTEAEMAMSELDYARLELISKFAAALCKYRPMPFNKN